MKVLAIASKGGHWIQLLRITKALTDIDIVYVSTNSNFSKTVKGHRFYTVSDGNRNSLFRLILTFFRLLRIVYIVNPKIILTTGAAPGLMGILVGAIYGKKTIWVDSMANVEEISTSGKIAHYFASRVYTQWPKLANSKFIYSGNILS